MSIMTNSKAGITDKTIYAIVVFIGIFMPCLIKVRMHYIIFGIELIYIVKKIINTGKITFYKAPLKMIATFLPFYFYYTFLVIFRAITDAPNSSLYWTEYTQSLSIAIYIIVLAISIMLYKQTHGINSSAFFQVILIITTMQFLFVGLSFVFPSVKAFFNSFTIRNSFNEAIISVMNRSWYLRWRAYGLAENLFDGFGFVISILISIVFVHGLSSKKKEIIALAWIMLIMPLLNTRTGLVLCFISFIYIMFRYLNVKRAITFSVLIVLLVVSFFVLFKYLPQELQDVLSNSVTEFKGLAQGQKKGVFNQIFGVDIVFPDDVLFGAGISPERITDLVGIDSGYIQSFWRFGIIGTILLWCGYVASTVIAYRNTALRSNKVTLMVVLLLMVVYCFKLFLFNSYANNFLLFFILFYIGLEENEGLNPFEKLVKGMSI